MAPLLPGKSSRQQSTPSSCSCHRPPRTDLISEVGVCACLTNVRARALSKDFLPHFISFPTPTPFSSQAQSRGLHWSHRVAFEPQVNLSAALAARLSLPPAPRGLPVRFTSSPALPGERNPGLVRYRARELGSLSSPSGAISYLLPTSPPPPPTFFLVAGLEHGFHVIVFSLFHGQYLHPKQFRLGFCFPLALCCTDKCIQMHLGAHRTRRGKVSPTAKT